VDDSSDIIIEYRFNYNGNKIADVAYIDNNKIVCIFEIYNTHKTQDGDRPEPWFEIDAKSLIQTVNSSPIGESIVVKCCRSYWCEDCRYKNCKLCGVQTQTWLLAMHNMCINCHVERWDRIYLNVSYNGKESIKSLGGKYDGLTKKWYISSNNPNKEIILQKWSSIKL
jgi:hypothetical protein